MCIILADGCGKSGTDLDVLQVIEGLLYNRRKREATIILDFMVKSGRKEDSSLLLLHPGLVQRTSTESNLANLIMHPPVSDDGAGPQSVLKRMYAPRMTPAASAHSPAFRLRSKNPFLLAEGGKTEIHHWNQPPVRTVRIIDESVPTIAKRVPPFTCFEIAGIKEGISWFRLELQLVGRSYAHFVGDRARFWVDGPGHVFDLIEAELTGRRDPLVAPFAAFLQSSFAPAQRLKTPAYEVIVFRSGTKGVDTEVSCIPATADVYEDTTHSVTALAHLFIASSPRFWIDLSYDSASDAEIERPSGEIATVPA